MEKCLIVAVADDLAIGVKGGLPWHLSEDLKYFKEQTRGLPVIMGRTTYFSLPIRPLPGRRNIVLNLGGDPTMMISFSLVPDFAPTMSLALMAQGIFMLIRFPVMKAR